jgi:superfamily II DNA or RNA helicase
MSKAELRPYQKNCVDAVLAARKRGRRRVLYVQATGLGKTVAFCNIVDQLVRSERRPALVIAHRDELLDQASRRMLADCPGFSVQIEAGTRKANPRAHVVVSSVQTLGRKESKRLAWLEKVSPSVIICDEAHRAAAQSYGNVFERFGAFDGRSFLVGCTATPKRFDRKALTGEHGAVFEEQVFDYGIRDGINDGYLCPIRGFRVVSDVDLGSVKQTAGDFNQGDLASAVDVKPRTKRAIDHWFEVANGRKTIVFCASVEHAHHAAEAWQERGITAECIHGELHRETRKAILRRFATGETQVVTNVECLTEGFDQPDVSCIVMLRPTQSWGLYMQMAGRGTRLAPGKSDCLIIDVVDNCKKHSLATVPALLDLPPGLDLQGHSLTEAADKIDSVGAQAAVLQDANPDTFDDILTMLQDVDLFARVDPPVEVENNSDLNWLSVPGGYYLSCGDGRSARLTQDALGDYRLTLQDSESFEDLEWVVGENPEVALPGADRIVLDQWPQAIGVVRRGARWRMEPPTEKQIGVLRRAGYSMTAIAALSKGKASSLITQVMQSRRVGNGPACRVA